ncbi:MAG: histidine kinase [Chitinophagales bacterium]
MQNLIWQRILLAFQLFPGNLALIEWIFIIFFLLSIGFSAGFIICRIVYNKRFSSNTNPGNAGFSDQTTPVIQSERKYKMLFESNPMPMWVLSLENYRITDVNHAALRHYGYSKEEFMMLDSRKMRPLEEEQRFLEDMRQKIQGVSNRGHWTHRKKGGGLIQTEISVLDFESEGKPVRLVLSNDITEQFRTADKLKRSYDEIRGLASHLQDVREEERAGIAREIHDELGQQLTSLKMDLSWLSKKMNPENEFIRERIANSLSLLDDTIKTVRRIASELRPGILDDLGLVPAIEWQAEEFQKRFSIPTYFSSDLDKTNFPAGVSIGLFRICQESLTNIARHAFASKINIALNQEAENILLSIEDNGKGFQSEKHGDQKTLGLLGMKERALMMGGKFQIESRQGKGTSVYVTVPYNIIG